MLKKVNQDVNLFGKNSHFLNIDLMWNKVKSSVETKKMESVKKLLH